MTRSVAGSRVAVVAAAVVGIVGLGCAPPPGPATPPDAPSFTDDHGELVVDLVDGTDLDAFLADYPELRGATRWNSPNVADEAIAVAAVPLARQAELLARLSRDARVQVAEHNGLHLIEPTSLLSSGGDTIPDDGSHPPRASFPNDPLYERQWNMELVRARDAWRYATGEGVIVAVIDTGVAYETAKGLQAPDLAATRFVAGYDFVNDDAIAADDHGHGTHCAGTIAQSTDNGRGVVGLAPRCRIMPLKVLSAGGWGTTSDIADAIRFAADHGAHVLSLSLGGGGYSHVLAGAVAYARDRGCMVVCAAGNGGRARVEYPAAYGGATAVASVGPTGQLAYYSSFGREVFVAAPGGDKSRGPQDGVLQNTLDPNGRRGTVYAFWQGTSMATPHVAAACALLHEVGVTRPDAIEDVLRATARGDGGWNQRTGWGVLDAGAAVSHAVFVPGLVALGVAAVLVVAAVRRTSAREAPRALLALGALAGSAGLFFLRPLGLGEVPVVGGLLTRGLPDWDLVVLGPAWHWSPLFASALVPALAGFVALGARVTRTLGVGLCLGWAARLATGVALPYADVQWIPGSGLLDGLWLAGNAAVLVVWAAALVRLGRAREQAA